MDINVEHSLNTKNNLAYQKNALVLAYLGDSVFTLMVRSYLVASTGFKTRELNKKANSIVCAKAQAEIMQNNLTNLTEDELDIAMRARNTHANNKAKNSTLQEYSLATQLESLIGYWYLTKNQDRLNLVEQIIKEKL